jgi:hypothetical protein
MNDGTQFRLSLAKWAAKFPDQMGAIARQTCQQISYNVVEDTPVDTGFLRSSWQPSIGKPQTTDGKQFGGDVEANAAISASIAKSAIGITLAGIKAGDVFWMTNNANYAPYVEFGTAHMRGRFFVTDNMKRGNAVVQQVLKELKL